MYVHMHTHTHPTNALSAKQLIHINPAVISGIDDFKDLPAGRLSERHATYCTSEEDTVGHGNVWEAWPFEHCHGRL